MREASGKGRAIIEDVFRFPFTATQLFVERVKLIPKFQDCIFLGWKMVILSFLNVLHALSCPELTKVQMPKMRRRQEKEMVKALFYL